VYEDSDYTVVITVVYWFKCQRLYWNSL